MTVGNKIVKKKILTLSSHSCKEQLSPNFFKKKKFFLIEINNNIGKKKENCMPNLIRIFLILSEHVL
jgi:hypothetical protein